MKSTVKGSKEKNTDCRERVRQITFTAENPVDEVELGGLYRHWFNLEKDELLTKFRVRVIERYCKKHKVKIVIS